MELPDPFAYEYAHPWVLWLLAGLPLVGAYMLWPRRGRHGALTFSQVEPLRRGGRGWRRYLEPAPGVLRLLALALFIVALARPQTSERHEIAREGIDIFIALDMSGSMEGIDLSEVEVRRRVQQGDYPRNRFEVAVDVLKRFVDERADDRIGMVIFGEEAHLEFPLTVDRGTILALLEERELGDIRSTGTAIGDAVARAVAGLRRSEAPSKVIVLITDGDRRGGRFSPRQAASMAKHFGVEVFPILVGREGLDPVVPEDETWRNLATKKFPVNEALLKEIASITGGKYYRASEEAALWTNLQDILNQYERIELESEVDVEHTDHYLPYTTWALFFLFLEAGLACLVIRKYP